jgi:hypothetical protein
VSWYEAAAYAEFAGKSLPTVYHWYHAAQLGIVSRILSLSNFSRQGPAQVGAYRGLGPFGSPIPPAPMRASIAYGPSFSPWDSAMAVT